MSQLPHSPVKTPEAGTASDERLDSWKEIASYLKRDVRTVQRWEKKEGLPVHRHIHDKLGSVYAFKQEVDEWWKGRHERIEESEAITSTGFFARSSADDSLRSVPQSIRARYEIQAHLGSGGMGVVYKARDRETGEVVALKVLRPELATSPEVVERFKNELRLARKVTHKRVCRIHEFVRGEDCSYISMEFVEGESLRQILNRFGTLNFRTSMAIARQICAGLQEAHAQGVIHRDLKPENVMLDPHGDVKLMDFGIACTSSDGTSTGKIFGTPAYMAPEQAEGQATDPRTDLYAVGLILYEMVTGRPAFTGDTPLGIVLKQVRETPLTPRSVEPHIPEQLETLILRAVEKSPEKRFQSAREMEEQLVNEGETPPVLEASETAELLLPRAASQWSLRDWALLVAGVLGAIAFFLLFDNVFPYSSYRLGVSADEATLSADSIVRRYAPQMRHEDYSIRFDAGFQMLDFPHVVQRHGVKESIQRARATAGSWSVSSYPHGSPEEAFTPGALQLVFDVSGQLRSLRLPSQPADTGRILMIAEGESVAAKFAEDLYDLPISAARPDKLSYDAQQKVWLAPAPDGIGERLSPPVERAQPYQWSWDNTERGSQSVRVWLAGDRLVASERFPVDFPFEPVATQWKEPDSRWINLLTTGFIFSALLFLFIAGHLYVLRPRPLLVAVALLTLSLVVALALAPVTDGPVNKGQPTTGSIPRVGWSMTFFLTGVVGIVVFAVLAFPYHALTDTASEKIASFQNLANGRYWCRAIGLAIVRGTLVGGVMLAVYVVGLALLAKFKITFEPLPADMLTGEITNTLVNGIGKTFGAAILEAWIMIALPFALLKKFGGSLWLALVLPSVVAVMASNPLDGFRILPVLPFFTWAAIQVFLLALVFWHWDLLTCMATVLTIETFVLLYPTIRVFGQIHPWIQVWAFVPWGLFLVTGVTIWTMPPLKTGYRRLTTAFEYGTRPLK